MLVRDLQPDGKLVAAGWSYTGSRNEFALVRYKPDGSLDTGFNGTGKLTTDFLADSGADGLVLQQDGRLVAAGNVSGSQGWFALARYLGSTLSVGKAGSGAGTVTSSPAGITCGSTCSAPFGAISVTLTASPASGSTFTGWSGSPCTGTGTCALTMSTDHAVTATFEADKTLTVTKSGAGAGTITSTPAGISCGAGCSHSYRYGSTVTLTATPAAGSSFAGWSGACTGTGTCSITTGADKTVTAAFSLVPASSRKCVVPKVKGKTLKKARHSIKAHACSLGKVKRVGSRTVKKGHVISQKPKPGRRLKLDEEETDDEHEQRRDEEQHRKRGPAIEQLAESRDHRRQRRRGEAAEVGWPRIRPDPGGLHAGLWLLCRWSATRVSSRSLPGRDGHGDAGRSISLP